MKETDLYNLLIAEQGFPLEGDEILINIYEDELIELKSKIGILPQKDIFNLILKDDDQHFTDEVICDLLPYYGDRAGSLMMEAHVKGAVILQSGEYMKLKKIQDELRTKDYNLIINKIEINE
jgi:ATP-dependent Clp protease adapter protein ClpS